MSFLGRFLGGSRSNAFSEGLALLEEERFAEAADRFRDAVRRRSDASSSSLASFHFRQALVAEGRRLLRAGRPDEAIPFFAEAVDWWESYPDLRCLLGVARGQAGDWDAALQDAHAALRLNADYVEARLLEAVALARSGREREAAESLGKLVEAGRRMDHWLIASLDRPTGFDEADLPDNLDELLGQAVGGRSEKEEVAAAVAQCRAGNWEDGLVRFEALVLKRPRYPDYRTRHAAAFFQLGRNEEALAEVEAALALNENYVTAVDLKGLVLADSRRIRDAREFLAEADARLAHERGIQGHEDLFGAYLRGAVALLAGEPEAVAPYFETVPELGRTFARAELLRAAADDLLGRSSVCQRRLAGLVEEWPTEAVYFHLLACHHLEHGRYQDAAETLSGWPAGKEKDLRPLYLKDALMVAQGGQPEDGKAETDTHVTGPARDFLRAQAARRCGDPAECWRICVGLADDGYRTERVAGLMIRCAGDNPSPAGPEWRPPEVLPESCLPAAVFLHYRRRRGDEARHLLEAHHAVHPELLLGNWLAPEFWLDPIRAWIG